jgi:Tfp pilus assembly protein PilF
MDKLQKLHQFLEEDPGDAFTRYALAMEYVKEGDNATAAKFFQELIEQSPDYVGTYYHYGKLKESQNDFEGAAELYRQGIEQAKAKGDHKNQEELQEALMLISDEEPDDDEFDI